MITAFAKNFMLQEAQAHRDMEVFMRRLFKLLDENGFKHTVIHDSVEIEMYPDSISRVRHEMQKGVGA